MNIRTRRLMVELWDTSIRRWHCCTHLSVKYKGQAVDSLPEVEVTEGGPLRFLSGGIGAVVVFHKQFVFNAAGVAKLAYAADSKSLANRLSTTSKTCRNLPKTSFKPTTGADFSPLFRQKMGESYRKSIGDI